MKGIAQSLRSVFQPLAQWAAAALLAIPLATTPALAVDGVMPKGPNAMVYGGLERAGYEPVAYGERFDLNFRTGEANSDETTLVAVFADADRDWALTRDSGKTTEILLEGSDLSIERLFSTMDASYDLNVPAADLQDIDLNMSATLPCADYETFFQNMSHQNLGGYKVTGLLDDGQALEIYVNKNGSWITAFVTAGENRQACMGGDVGANFTLTGALPKVS